MKFKWHVMLMIFVVSLVILGGGVVIFEKYYYQNPLQEQLEDIEKVEKVEIETDRNNTRVEINNSYATYLPSMVTEIKEVLKDNLGDEYSLIVNDKPNQNLEALALAVKPALYEGARLGNYRSVNNSIQDIAANYSTDDLQFSVDENFVYLQAQDGDNYLYIIVPHFENYRGVNNNDF